MQPAAEGVVRGPEGATVRVLEDPGKLYAAYIYHARVVKDGKPKFQVDAAEAARQVTLQLSRGAYLASWRDTRKGSEVKLEKFEVGGPRQETRLMSPVYSEDIALLVRSTSQTKR
jgi:hypothetical protein